MMRVWRSLRPGQIDCRTHQATRVSAQHSFSRRILPRQIAIIREGMMPGQTSVVIAGRAVRYQCTTEGRAGRVPAPIVADVGGRSDRLCGSKTTRKDTGNEGGTGFFKVPRRDGLKGVSATGATPLAQPRRQASLPTSTARESGRAGPTGSRTHSSRAQGPAPCR